MRQSLMGTFTDIYILNLHGSSKKQEKCPDGSKDENVFDIQQGVAISIFVKKPGKKGTEKVNYAELWGLRASKYTHLLEESIATTQWTELKPKAEQYFFVPKDFSLYKEYISFLSLGQDIFSESNAGIQTKNDGFVYQYTEGSIQNVIKDLRETDSKAIATKYDLSSEGHWSLLAAQRDIQQNTGQIAQMHYRPFDKRWTYYTGKTSGLMARPRAPLMRNALLPNLLLLTIRNARRGNTDSFFVANTIVDKDAVSPFDNATFFPLYLYTDRSTGSLFDMDIASDSLYGRHPNLTLRCIAYFTEHLNLQFVSDGKGNLQHTFGPEDIFNYMYAIFHSHTYRERYAEFIKIDFPRLPLTTNVDLFRELCRIGDWLVGLHLMEKVGKVITKYPESGNHIIEKVDYTQPANSPEQSRVWINKTQYFEGVPPEVWEFHVGGYQVCHKWLKDRKGRALSFDDIKHYQRIVAALTETITLMEQIDEVIEEHGGWPIQ